MAMQRLDLQNTGLSEAKVTDLGLAEMRKLGMLPEDGRCDHDAFEKWRAAVKAHFEVPWTSITPPMERLLYGITCAKRPRSIVAIGTFCGNTLAWVVGPACEPGKCYSAERLVGLDVDEKAVATARRNYAALPPHNVELLLEDGHAYLDRTDFPIDLLYLDAHGPLPGTDGPRTKLIYLTLLERAYDRIPEGGLVVAHDTTPEYFIRQAQQYLEYVRDKSRFRESISLEPDSEGLEVSMK